ncbi:MAG: hypothetical protein V8T36_06060 [Ruthenibacterium lactatiformans]
MLFDADAVCRAAFCREVAQGAGPRLHDAALCAGAGAGAGARPLAPGNGPALLAAGGLCLREAWLLRLPGTGCHVLAVALRARLAQPAAAGLAAPLAAVQAALCPQAVQALRGLAAAEKQGGRCRRCALAPCAR